MRLKRLGCSFLATSLLACGSADDFDTPEFLGEAHEELVTPGATGALLFARDGEATLMNLRGNVFKGKARHAPGGSWRPIATADFNGDGHGDILWRAEGGQLSLWTMFGGRSNGYTEHSTSPKWFFSRGTPMPADFNNDQVDDILWKGEDIHFLPAGGYTSIPVTERWRMQPSSVAPASISSSRDAGWTVAGVGRFRADGGDNANRFWVSTDGYRTRIDSDGFPPYDGPTVHPDWQVKGVADFNADGVDDILWRNWRTGDFGIWPMSWGSPSAYPIVGNVIVGWNIVGAGDIDGDNVAEIIWRDQPGNVAVTMLHSNFTVRSYGAGIPLGADYKFVGVVRSPGKFGHARLVVNKPRVKPDACPTWTFTVRPTNGPQFTRNVSLGFPEVCSYTLEMVDFQDTYTVTYPGGCHKLNVMGADTTVVTVAPADRCTPPTPPPPTTPPPPPNPPPNPPQPPPQVTSTAMMTIWGGGQAPLGGNVWYGGLFPAAPVITGSAVKITNTSTYYLGFPTHGNTTDQCGDLSKIVFLPPGAATSSAQMSAIYGTAQPRLPITLVACATGDMPMPNPPIPPLPTTVYVQVAHIAN